MAAFPLCLGRICMNERKHLTRKFARRTYAAPELQFTLLLTLLILLCVIRPTRRHIVFTDENLGDGTWHTDHTLIIRPSAESVI